MSKTVENLLALADFIEEHVPQERICTDDFATRDCVGCTGTAPDNLPPDGPGMAFGPLGWEALRVPEVAARFDNWPRFGRFQFWDLSIVQHVRCLGAGTCSDKQRLVQRLRALAKELAAEA